MWSESLVILRAARIVSVHGAAAIEAFALFDPFAGFRVIATVSVWASSLMAEHTVNHDCLTLIASDSDSLGGCGSHC